MSTLFFKIKPVIDAEIMREIKNLSPARMPTRAFTQSARAAVMWVSTFHISTIIILTWYWYSPDLQDYNTELKKNDCDDDTPTLLTSAKEYDISPSDPSSWRCDLCTPRPIHVDNDKIERPTLIEKKFWNFRIRLEQFAWLLVFPFLKISPNH